MRLRVGYHTYKSQFTTLWDLSIPLIFNLTSCLCGPENPRATPRYARPALRVSLSWSNYRRANFWAKFTAQFFNTFVCFLFFFKNNEKNFHIDQQKNILINYSINKVPYFCLKKIQLFTFASIFINIIIDVKPN